MITSTTIEAEALRFIQNLDEVVFEAFTDGHITGNEYRRLAKKIATIQSLIVNILSAFDCIYKIRSDNKRL